MTTVDYVADRITTASAVGAVGYSYWLPTIAEMSPALSLVAQILGVLWLACRLYQWFGEEALRREKRRRA